MSDDVNLTDKGILEIDLANLIQMLRPEQRQEIAQMVAFEESMLRATAETLIDGMCFDDYWWIGGDFVEKLRHAVLPHVNKIARELILDLIQQRDRARQQEERWREWAWKLYHFRQDTRDLYETPRYEGVLRGGREAMAEMEKLAKQGGLEDPPTEETADETPY